ncbi:MAG TPA: STAS domain-containing protein [Acidimicrobiales bacterium]|jgi:anti-anti-sigma factor|nr:STAS domain-containing protein [Acidimicrobiales bacterium]
MTLEHAASLPEPSASEDSLVHSVGDHSLQISISQMEDRCLVVLSGELDVSSAPLLREQLVAITTTVQTGLILDIGLLTFIDSTGLSLLVAEHKKLESQGATLTIFSPTPMARRLFEISGLTGYLTIVPPAVAT